MCSVLRQVTIERGTRDDYRALARHHYCAGMPVAAVLVGVAWHVVRGRRVRAGVVVVTMPCLNNAARTGATGGRYELTDKRARARRLNRELRTIARVVVHPRYRGIGLGRRLVRWALLHAGTRHVEAIAHMGRVHPFFVRAGMQAVDVEAGRPGYFLYTRRAGDGQKD